MPEKVWPRLSHEERSARRWAAFVEPGFEFASPRAEAEYRRGQSVSRSPFPVGRTTFSTCLAR